MIAPPQFTHDSVINDLPLCHFFVFCFLARKTNQFNGHIASTSNGQLMTIAMTLESFVQARHV